jgi:PAS domain S-box-containing protein
LQGYRTLAIRHGSGGETSNVIQTGNEVTSPAQGPGSLLVVDNDPECLKLLTTLLAPEGLVIRSVENSAGALALLESHRPELILVDFRMASSDGFQVCRQVQARAEWRSIPILFMSASDTDCRAEALRAGASDFIAKPFQHEELLARVRTHVELSRLRAAQAGRTEEQIGARRDNQAALEAQLEKALRRVARLRTSHRRLRELARNMPAWIWMIGPDGRLLFHNKRRYCGCAAARTGDAWAAMADPDDVESVRAKYATALNRRCSFQIECRLSGAYGSKRWVLHSGIPWFIHGAFAGHLGATIDIADFKGSYEQKLAAEKLESLGAFSAGIAHDLNNLAGVIFAASDLALSDLPPDSAVRAHLERINAAAVRASEIVKLLRSYAGEVDAPIDPMDLSLVVAEMLELVKGTIPSRVVLDVSLASTLPEIRGNVTQIRQVILNLLMNAFESLDPHGGSVRVATDCVSSRRHRSRHGERDYCRLVISDTGCGVAGKAHGRIFDPFYSTKSIGRGLGLALVHGVVRSMGGSIEMRATPGGGTSFEVLFPRSQHDLPRARQAAVFS